MTDTGTRDLQASQDRLQRAISQLDHRETTPRPDSRVAARRRARTQAPPRSRLRDPRLVAALLLGACLAVLFALLAL